MHAKIIDRYLLNELSEDERAGFEEHYFACSVCAAEVALAAKFIDNARKPLLRLEDRAGEAGTLADPAGDPVETHPLRTSPPPSSRRSWWERWLDLAPKPALAAACAGLLVAVGVLLRPPAVLPEVTGSYFVAATRATENEIRKIRISNGQQRIALLFNRTDPSLTRFDFVLENASGRALLHFHGEAPQDTDDIQILVPVAGMASGRYNLRVRDAVSKTEAAVLPFELLFQ